MLKLNKTLGMTVLAFLMLSSCSMNKNITTQYSPVQIAQAIITGQESISVLQLLLPIEEYYSEYLTDIYILEADTIKDGAIYYFSGMMADEIAVLLIDDASKVKDVKDALVTYKERRTEAFMGYAPEQAAILENSIVVAHGNYVALLICENPQKAESVFKECFSSNPPKINEDIISTVPDNNDDSTSESIKTPDDMDILYEPADEPESSEDTMDDIYDPDSIIQAWQSGDMSGLSNKNKSILEACIDIISINIHDDMSDYEKELTIHDWIIDWTQYDKDANNNSPDANPDPDNDNPYGLIFNKKSICRGYTTTFQLFMDLLGIECIIVEGIAAHSGNEHAWNMVRIDGKWYCVDVTWNDPSGGDQSNYAKHEYFNVTSEFMRDTGHIWDESTTPIADSGKLFFD